MGQDKAELLFGDRTLLEHAAAVLAPVCGEVLLASGEENRANSLGLRCVLDAEPGQGPLAGIRAALSAASGEWLCVAACDMPGIATAHFETLLTEAARRDLDALWYRSEGLDEPLFAVYRTTCLEAMQRALESERFKVIAFTTEPGPAGRPLRLDTLELSPTELRIARNLNTPEDVANERRARDPRTPES